MLLIKSVQEPKIIPPIPKPIVTLPVQETIAVHEDRTPKSAKYKFAICSAIAVVGIAFLTWFFILPLKNLFSMCFRRTNRMLERYV